MEVNRSAQVVLVHSGGVRRDALNQMCGAHEQDEAYHAIRRSSDRYRERLRLQNP